MRHSGGLRGGLPRSLWFPLREACPAPSGEGGQHRSTLSTSTAHCRGTSGQRRGPLDYSATVRWLPFQLALTCWSFRIVAAASAKIGLSIATITASRFSL